MNRLNLLLAAACCLTFVFQSVAQGKYQLAWSDEFNYRGLPDSSKWGYDTGGDGWGNHELEYYTVRRKENARVENGRLIIEARKEQWDGKPYTSARLVSRGRGDWQYGKILVRAKLPKGRGTWPAIWMLGSTTPLQWPDDGEIDIMEHVGFHPGYIHGSIHCKKYNHIIGTQKTDTTFIKDCSQNFHVYGLEWTADSIRISVDGKACFRFANEHTGYAAWPFDNKMYLLMNIAVGGDWGGQRGVDDSIWPQRMEVDYVRVYRLTTTAAR
jgi:beta-glucanase (GH16 family)